MNWSNSETFPIMPNPVIPKTFIDVHIFSILVKDYSTKSLFNIAFTEKDNLFCYYYTQNVEINQIFFTFHKFNRLFKRLIQLINHSLRVQDFPATEDNVVFNHYF